jgi:hypothetical protein
VAILATLDPVIGHQLRPAEARDARNRALLTELRAMETIHGRLGCGMLARKMHPDDPLAVAALVKHLGRLRRRNRDRMGGN